MFVINADLLTKLDYVDMLEQHQAAGAAATMAVREYELQVPFGVVREADGCIERIEEKPIQRFARERRASTCCRREVLRLVPADTCLDMPSLFAAVIAGKMRTRSYRVSGYWIDIGRMADYERANRDFPEIFE